MLGPPAATPAAKMAQSKAGIASSPSRGAIPRLTAKVASMGRAGCQLMINICELT